MAEIQKQELTSMNITEDQLLKLKQLFPEAFTEGLKVDWEKLRLTLGEAIDTGKERYGMNWPGKSECFKTIQQPSIATLIPARDESVDFDKTENLFIKGDNLEVLKLLQKSYLGKIKFMYFDPPYNTGKEFIYPDNYAENLDTYLQYTGQIDSDGKKFTTNTETDGRFHSKWMNMMYPRLFLAKNLLKEDGLIFISIDDNEINNLKVLLNEIFGEENFVAQFIWKSRQNKDNRSITGVSTDHEYIICFAKQTDEKLIRGDERKIDQYKNPDNDSRGSWVSGNMVGLLPENLRPNCHYDLINPETGINYGKPKLGWRYDKNTMKRLIEEKRILWPEEATGRPRKKVFLNELKGDFTGLSSIIGENIFTRDGTKEISDLFGFKAFDFPKPSNLIKSLLLQSTNEDDLVLDIFAGSGTTAHAVLDLNKEDGGSRKFICVQIPEPTDEKSEAFIKGYKTIADITKDRIKKVSEKIKIEFLDKTAKEAKTIFGTPNSNIELDLGFKVYKLAQSNFKIWDATLEKTPEVIQAKLFEHINHISPEAEQEAILYELLLKSGFELTTPIEKLTLAGLTVFSIAEGQLLICLEKELSHDCLKAMAELHPTRVICLDEAFKGTNADALKTNAVQIMKSKGVVNFRTV
ncbi:MAG: site-specific DNA-methyltransferase [Cytophagales bacterium]|nr:site-specific DNA-methyltransferase [Cytophagales bacterium]MCA6444146.1 site-specific DNA-methyltransferase [Bacteroidota bacterium]